MSASCLLPTAYCLLLFSIRVYHVNRRLIKNLVDELGFDGVDAGGLDESWRQQPGTPVYAADFDAEGVRQALSNASKERKPEWRAK